MEDKSMQDFHKYLDEFSKSKIGKDRESSLSENKSFTHKHSLFRASRAAS